MFHMPVPVGLKDGFASDFVCSQVSITKAVSVDAYQMPEIHYLTICLGRVTNNHTLSAHMGSGERSRQVSPVRQRLRLFKHRHIRIVGRVYKYRVLGFVIGEQFMQENKDFIEVSYIYY